MMLWWNGQGAARVFAVDGRALLLERATGPRSLLAMSQTGRDIEATRTICSVVASLHAPRRDRFAVRNKVPLTEIATERIVRGYLWDSWRGQSIQPKLKTRVGCRAPFASSPSAISRPLEVA
jgi:hypothetical protein